MALNNGVHTVLRATVTAGANQGIVLGTGGTLTDATLAPHDVPNARWTSNTVLTWDATTGAAVYHAYRDLRSNLS